MNTIEIIEETLSDGSKVYAVRVRIEDGSVDFRAVTYSDAWDFAEKLHEAMRDHTLNTVRFA